MNGTSFGKGSAATVGTLLRTLVEQHVPSTRFESTLSVASRLLDSSLTTAPSMQSSDALTGSMVLRLRRSGRDEDANKLATLTTSLKFDRGIAQSALWPILYILNDLRGSAIQRLPSQTDMAKLRSSLSDAWSSPPSKPTTLPPPPAVDVFPSVTQTVPMTRDKDKPNSAQPIPNVEPKIPVAIQSPHAIRSLPSNGPSNVAVQNRSLEYALVQDLMLIVQGENGKHLSFVGVREDETVHIDLTPGLELTLPMHDMVHCVAELGFLFRVIRAFVNSSDESAGLVAQNLYTAIDRELDNYYRSLVTLRESRQKGGSSNELDDDGLSLRRVYVWAEQERHRLRWLARLCEETRTLHGGQIVAHIRSCRGSYISTDIRDMMSRILRSTSAPLNLLLVRWLSEGVLPDAHGEFFVMEDPKVAATVTANPFSAEAVEEGGMAGGLAGGPNLASAASNRIWWGLFKLRKEMVPGCVDKSCAQKSLITGKSVAFMRRCCSDSEWVDEFHAPLVEALTSNERKLFEADLKYDDNAVQEVVERACSSASKRLKELFFERFDLNHHFGAIKKYLLLSQGDFAQALMDGLASLLDGGGEILQHNLTSYVDASLQSCSSFNEQTDWDILERLDVQIDVKEESTDVGWDVFSLTYRVEDAPLNTVFSPKVMDAYLLVFRLLWRLKRMDHLMSLAYQSLRETEKRRQRREEPSEPNDLDRRKEVDRVMKRVHFLRMKIIHLVHNMQHYCKVEVLEGCWAVLEQEMKEAEDLDGMIVAHARYLTMIKDMTLQSDRSRYVAAELDAVLDTVPRFSLVQKEVCTWALSVGQNDFNATRNDSNAEQMIERLAEIEREFDIRFAKLLEVLATHCQMVDACVFLLFRLDFNEYYARKEAAEALLSNVEEPPSGDSITKT